MRKAPGEVEVGLGGKPVVAALQRDFAEQELVEHRLAQLARELAIARLERGNNTPPAQAELFDAAGDTAELLIVEGGDHGFGGKHPYAGATPELHMVAEASLEWFDTHLD